MRRSFMIIVLLASVMSVTTGQLTLAEERQEHLWGGDGSLAGNGPNGRRDPRGTAEQARSGRESLRQRLIERLRSRDEHGADAQADGNSEFRENWEKLPEDLRKLISAKLDPEALKRALDGRPGNTGGGSGDSRREQAVPRCEDRMPSFLMTRTLPGTRRASYSIMPPLPTCTVRYAGDHHEYSCPAYDQDWLFQEYRKALDSYVASCRGVQPTPAEAPTPAPAARKPVEARATACVRDPDWSYIEKVTVDGVNYTYDMTPDHSPRAYIGLGDQTLCRNAATGALCKLEERFWVQTEIRARSPRAPRYPDCPVGMKPEGAREATEPDTPRAMREETAMAPAGMRVPTMPLTGPPVQGQRQSVQQTLPQRAPRQAQAQGQGPQAQGQGPQARTAPRQSQITGLTDTRSPDPGNSQRLVGNVTNNRVIPASGNPGAQAGSTVFSGAQTITIAIPPELLARRSAMTPRDISGASAPVPLPYIPRIAVREPARANWPVLLGKVALTAPKNLKVPVVTTRTVITQPAAPSAPQAAAPRTVREPQPTYTPSGSSSGVNVGEALDAATTLFGIASGVLGGRGGGYAPAPTMPSYSAPRTPAPSVPTFTPAPPRRNSTISGTR